MTQNEHGDDEADQEIGDKGIDRAAACCIRPQQRLDAPLEDPGRKCPRCIENDNRKESDPLLSSASKESLARAVPRSPNLQDREERKCDLSRKAQHVRGLPIELQVLNRTAAGKQQREEPFAYHQKSERNGPHHSAR